MGRELVSIYETATTSRQAKAFKVDYVVFVVNDGDNPIIFSMNGDLELNEGENGVFRLNPGEDWGALNLDCSNIAYKTTTGTSSFRAVGRRSKN